MRKFFSTQKIKIKSFLKKWKAENLIIKDCDKRTPLHCKVSKICTWLCIILMFFIWLSAFPTSAADTGGTSLPVTNLTGYTVTVPAGWTASTEYGEYNVEFTDTFGNGSDAFRIGYSIEDGDYIATSNSICFWYTIGYEAGGCETLTPTDSFTFSFTGGFDVTSRSLINWLENNNATFELTEPELPEHDTFFMPEGYYGLSDLAGELSPPIENTTVNLEKTYSIPVQLFYSNGLVKQYNHFGYMLTSYTDEDNYSADFVVHLLDTDLPTRVASFVASEGVSSFNFYGGVSHIYIPEAVTIIIDDTMDSDFRYLFTYTFTLDTSFIPDEPNVPDFPAYNMWAYFLEMIIEALKIPIFGYFSIWDIFVTFCGISIVIWFLKLLAGG